MESDGLFADVCERLSDEARFNTTHDHSSSITTHLWLPLLNDQLYFPSCVRRQEASLYNVATIASHINHQGCSAGIQGLHYSAIGVCKPSQGHEKSGGDLLHDLE